MIMNPLIQNHVISNMGILCSNEGTVFKSLTFQEVINMESKKYEDMTKSEMVRIISEQKGLTLPALERATKVDISNLAKALKVNADYKGAK
mgnify:FL=1|tara:strand:- start:306 stop:578 length:273 start_codon:yes stop_codon:yes gene_type:complete